MRGIITWVCMTIIQVILLCCSEEKLNPLQVVFGVIVLQPFVIAIAVCESMFD